MRILVRFEIDADGIANICLYEHRRTGAPLIRKKTHCQQRVYEHFLLFGESCASTGDVEHHGNMELTAVEREFVSWCLARKW